MKIKILFGTLCFIVQVFMSAPVYADDTVNVPINLTCLPVTVSVLYTFIGCALTDSAIPHTMSSSSSFPTPSSVPAYTVTGTDNAISKTIIPKLNKIEDDFTIPIGDLKSTVSAQKATIDALQSLVKSQVDAITKLQTTVKALCKAATPANTCKVNIAQ
jgi:uncharacterized coiled-coil protein SlyX